MRLDGDTQPGISGNGAGCRETFDDDLNTLPLKASHNLSLSLDYPLMRQVTVQAAVSNAFDAAIPVTHAGDGTIGYDTGRRISIGLVWRQ